ncbi:MAG TPA: redoxin domain-containing protein [Candidatus Butyricimonas faecavium]|nr:redoxin domain-containing protein [Candidatus Butyricimonas faecavium]
MIKKSLIILGLCLVGVMTWAQSKNTSVEVKDYREVDGKIILEMVVNGVIADFALDLAGHNAILPEYVEKLKIDPNVAGDFRYDSFQYKKVPVEKSVKIESISFGNSVFGNEVAAFVLKDASYLRKLGVAGVIGSSLFNNVVLTIDSKRKKITMSNPYRPSYMKLDHRSNMELITASGVVCPVVLDGVTYPLLLDTWNDGMVTLNTADFAKLNGEDGKEVKVYEGYTDTGVSARSKIVGECRFVKSDFSNIAVAENGTLPRSILGNGVLKKGLLSIDYGRRKVYFQPFDLTEVKDEIHGADDVKVEAGKLNPITREYFLEHIYDYRKDKEFVFKGDKPVVIDFWATWCGPCMRLIPELEKMAEKYKDQVIFLKVNADKEKELCGMFNIVALPTLFFIPVGGKPIIEMGATPEKFVEIIENQLLKK